MRAVRSHIERVSPIRVEDALHTRSYVWQSDRWILSRIIDVIDNFIICISEISTVTDTPFSYYHPVPDDCTLAYIMSHNLGYNSTTIDPTQILTHPAVNSAVRAHTSMENVHWINITRYIGYVVIRVETCSGQRYEPWVSQKEAKRALNTLQHMGVAKTANPSTLYQIISECPLTETMYRARQQVLDITPSQLRYQIDAILLSRQPQNVRYDTFLHMSFDLKQTRKIPVACVLATLLANEDHLSRPLPLLRPPHPLVSHPTPVTPSLWLKRLLSQPPFAALGIYNPKFSRKAGMLFKEQNELVAATGVPYEAIGFITIGVVVPCIYIALRHNKAEPEDMIQVALVIFSTFAIVINTLYFQIVRHRWSLMWALRGYRNIHSMYHLVKVFGTYDEALFQLMKTRVCHSVLTDYKSCAIKPEKGGGFIQLLRGPTIHQLREADYITVVLFDGQLALVDLIIGRVARLYWTVETTAMHAVYSNVGSDVPMYSILASGYDKIRIEGLQ
ncbi:hypothetical protein BWQ96_06794 [Gracilariopsis chorda]|uniref:Uncharacterized protein n=1 Tax=Gracilariopsis chorda TaxID=448386 RepID=A0A2V3IN44_9FLOR|nr:hypothetical protein BWQ96_06794 [Gracilariopsis chorda]|eukprot:PXF43501.1 hypothetical protein BWQ96_06794 [Gracilariopsis chorda]